MTPRAPILRPTLARLLRRWLGLALLAPAGLLAQAPEPPAPAARPEAAASTPALPTRPEPQASAPVAQPAAANTACPPAPAPLQTADVMRGLREARDRGLLWQIEQGGRTSWLYGTLHAAELAWMFPGPQVMAALRASHRVALELDMLDPGIQRQMQHAMRADPTQPPLPPALAERLAQAARAECAQAELAELRPEIQVATLSVLALRRDGLEPGYAIDGYLAGLARGLGKPVVSLETPQTQMAALRADDPAERERQVADTLDELASGRNRRQALRLARAWAEGDLDTLSHYADWCECLSTPAEQAALRRLLDERNPAMARQIARWHRGGLSVFAAVGALHLVGEQGLPALLAQQGFQVKRVLPHSAQSNPEPVSPPPAHGDSP